jgi:coatomer protein complex subunit alpha (xenin)
MYELAVTDIKNVYWSANYAYAAVLTKSQILIVNKNLEILNQNKETSKVKTGCFDENHAFIYSTSTHIKYIFCEGKTTGTFKSIEEPVYVTFVSPYSRPLTLCIV